MKMQKQMMLFSILAVLTMTILSVWAWYQVPADALVPVHWNAAGEVDRYGSKLEGLFLSPALTLLVTTLFYFLPKLDPRGENLLRSSQAFRAIWIVLLLFFLVVHFTTTFIALGFQLDIGKILMPGLGILFIVLGNYMGKIRQNYTMGIRTPWTLDSEEVWNKTHRFGGRLFVASGIVALAAAFLNSPWAIVLILISIFSAAVIPVVYSYFLYRQEKSSAS